MSKDQQIPEHALQWQFVRASGPGGQHVNKTSTAAVLRVDTGALGLSDAALMRLRQLAGKRLTQDGMLVIRCDESRSQLANRETALVRAEALLGAARAPVKHRIPTRVSKAQKRRRGEQKKRQSDKKRNRRTLDW
jgi:ribosome-associated protein